MSNREEQLGLLGVLTGDPALSAMGQHFLEKARREVAASGKRMHIGNGFIMEPDGTVSQDPGYASYIDEQNSIRDQRQAAQNQAMLDRMFVGADLKRSQPRYSTTPTEGGQAVIQTNPEATGGARMEDTIPVAAPIGPEARQKASEAERLAAEAMALRTELESVAAVKPGVDIPSDWLRQSDLTRGFAPALERSVYDENELAVRARGNRFEQNLSNLAAGLALTGYEIAERQKWSPFAPGINRSESLKRLDNVYRDFTTRAATIRGESPAQAARPSQPKSDNRRRKTLKGVSYVEVAPGEWEVDDGQ